MRKPIIAGNWKMNLTLAEAMDLAVALKTGLTHPPDDREILICPPYPYLTRVGEILAVSALQLGGQDLHWEKAGAFTGAVSGLMLKSTGCSHVLVGHSERRHVFGETDEVLQKKVKAAAGADLIPIFCVGELLQERDGGETEAVLERQITRGLTGLSKEALATLVLAYEPVWAIGTGRTATPQQAQAAHAFLRKLMDREFGASVSGGLRILYGGSVNPDNARSLMECEDVDGLLVGGASLKGDSFSKIVRYDA